MININNKTNKPNNLILKEVKLEKQIKKLQNNLPDFLYDYFNYLKTSVSLTTNFAYLTDINFYFNYLINELKVKKIDLNYLESIKARDVNIFIADYCTRYFKEENNKIEVFQNNNRTLSRKKSSLSSMFKFLFRNEQLKIDITPGFNPIKLPKRTPDSIKRLRENELINLINVVSKGEGLTKKQLQYWDKTKYRDILIILLFTTYGLRLNELINLNISSFNFSRMEFKIFRKRDKEALMPINNTILKALNDYIELERKNIVNEIDALLLSLQGRRLTSRQVRNLVKKYTAIAMKTSEKSAYSPHKLRATAASTLIERGFSIYDVQNLLDHDNITTTQLYASHKKDVKKDIIENFELKD